VLPAIVYGPGERKEWGADGIRTDMVISFIDSILAQAVRALDRYPLYLLLDRASCHNTEQMMQAFRDRGCGELVAIKKYPAKSAKRISPLDNNFIHEWKTICRSHTPSPDKTSNQ
jgi:hypothetical protein